MKVADRLNRERQKKMKTRKIMIDRMSYIVVIYQIDDDVISRINFFSSRREPQQSKATYNYFLTWTSRWGDSKQIFNSSNFFSIVWIDWDQMSQWFLRDIIIWIKLFSCVHSMKIFSIAKREIALKARSRWIDSIT